MDYIFLVCGDKAFKAGIDDCFINVAVEVNKFVAIFVDASAWVGLF